MKADSTRNILMLRPDDDEREREEKKQQQTPCQHNDEERSLTGTWVTDELKKALERGYVVQHIYEVWYFDETEQYDPKFGTTRDHKRLLTVHQDKDYRIVFDKRVVM